MKSLLYCIFFLCSVNFSLGQGSINGVVQDSLDSHPIEAVSVYFNGSLFGTTSNGQGEFSLKSPSEPQQLVFSAVGYKTTVFNTSDIINFQGSKLVIKLVRKDAELDAVVIKSATFKKTDSKLWKQKFLDYFIGTGEGANKCVIKNFDDITLKISDKQDILKAQSNKTVEIINPWLGYKIYFDIEECVITFSSNSFFCYGYTRFEDIGNGGEKIQKRRRAVYQGSLQHFLKALYHNTLQSQGFEVRHTRVFPNTEKARIIQLINNNKFDLDTHAEKLKIANSSLDSSAYYYKVYVKSKYQIIESDSMLLNEEDLFITDLDLFKEFYFKDYLLVTYKNKSSEELRLSPALPELELNKSYQNSLLSLKDDNSVFVFPNGRVSPPNILLAQGYWYTSNSMKNMLPFDYY